MPHKAARRRRGLDGEKRGRAIISSSDTVREIKYQILQMMRWAYRYKSPVNANALTALN
jgi:hypothetical protein